MDCILTLAYNITEELDRNTALNSDCILINENINISINYIKRIDKKYYALLVIKYDVLYIDKIVNLILKVINQYNTYYEESNIPY